MLRFIPFLTLPLLWASLALGAASHYAPQNVSYPCPVPPYQVNSPADVVSWTPVASAPHTYSRAGGGVLGNYLYEFGQDGINIAQAYNLTTGQWVNSTIPPNGDDNWASVVTNDAIYLIGGFFDTDALDCLQKFVPTGGGPTGTWTQLEPLAMPTAGGTAQWDGGNYIYFTGGNWGQYMMALRRYDIANNIWDSLGVAPCSFDFGGSAWFNGKMYVVGGTELAGNGQRHYMYNPANNSWTPKASLPVGVYFAQGSTTQNNNLMYVVGGGGGYGWWPATNAVQIYNPATDTWAMDTPLPGPTYGLNYARYIGGGSIIEGGGYNSTYFYTATTNRGDGFPVGQSQLSVTLTPLNPPIVVPAGGGSFSFTVQVIRNVGPAAPYTVWARIKNPNGSYTAPTLGPVTINTPVGVTISRQRNQTIPGTWAAGVYSYLGYANTSFAYPAIDSSSFTFTKSAAADDGSWVSDATCSGEPFPGERSMTASLPSGLDLKAGPNPFNPTTRLSYELGAMSDVTLKIYDTAGKVVAILGEGLQNAGTHEITFDGSSLASGVYIASLQAGEFTAVQKLVLLK
jgi:hypothetical protein